MAPLSRRVTTPTIRFSSRLVRSPDAGEPEASGVLQLPGNASAKLHSTGNPTVEGTINGFPFRAALEATRHAGHALRITRPLQTAAGATEGEPVSVEITRVGDEPECRVPTDFRVALAAAPPARTLWSQITPLARRDWILWICSAKQPETRRGRIEKACSMLASGKRRVCCFGGLRWLVKDHPYAGETWADLPGSR